MNSLLFKQAKLLGVILLCLLIGKKAYNQNVISQFTVDKTFSCISGNSFLFTNHSIGNNLSYKWDFKDGTFSSEINPIKSYTNSGNYAVTLIVTQNNIDYYFSKTITVAPEPVLSNIDIQKTFLGKSYTYISSSTIASGSMTYFWTFGDSVNSSLINPTHTYKDSGYYQVMLEAKSDLGCTAFKSKYARIIFHDTTTIIPTFSINRINQCIKDNKYTFLYTGDSSKITSIEWDFGDGSSDTGLFVSKRYSVAGNYFVKLTVVSNGITYTNEKIVTLNKIDASFNTTQLSDAASYSFFSNETGNLSVKQFSWSLGDGCTANNSSVTHTFFPGNYSVKLILKDENNCIDSTTNSIVISTMPATNIQAFFTVNDSFQCASSNSFHFKNLSTTACNINYLWQFGDGTTSTLFEPTKTYIAAGKYKVTLSVITGSVITNYERYVEATSVKIWTGKADGNWNNSANWMCGIPDSTDNIIIKSNSTFLPNFTNTSIQLNNLTIESGAIINATNCVFIISGNLTGKGLLNAADSKIIFKGNSLQTIDVAINIATMIVNNSNNVNVINTNSDSINIYSLLSLVNGNLFTNDRLVLKSSALKTAKLDKVGIDGNIGSISGEVTVERYFQNKRAWRFYTMPFSSNGNIYKYNINNTFQKFTNVTGPQGTGFDYLSSYYSLNAWSDATNKWDNVKNTFTSYTVNNNSSFANVPYFIFIRGTKNVAEAWVSNAVTFSFSGKLQTGDQQINYSGRQKGNYLFLGNPYASSVDLAKVQNQSRGLSGNFYYWDPSLNTNGAYVTISNKGNGVWITTPSAAQKGRYMQSCEAMLFELADPSGYVKFTEDAKCDTNYTNVFGSASGLMDKLTLNLYKVSSNGDKHLVDGAITLFNKNYSKDVDENDSKKVMNPLENIGFVNGNNVLAIETKPFVTSQDSLHIYTSGLNDTSNYAIEIIADYTDTTVQEIMLVDSNLQNKSHAYFNTASWYYFTHNNANNIYNSRFSIILKSVKSINGVVKEFKVVKDNKDALLTWFVEAEQGVREYQIQYSKNGKDFITILTQNPSNNNKTNNYNITALLNGVYGKHYYRVKTILDNDVELVSGIEMVEFIQPIVIDKKFYVYPNPTNNIAQLHFYTENSQWFVVEIIDPITGRTINTKNVNALKGENLVAINFAEFKNISSGLYFIKISSEDSNFKSLNVMYRK